MTVSVKMETKQTTVLRGENFPFSKRAAVLKDMTPLH